MSTQRGNVKKRGPPKHQNKTAFKNTLHDKSSKTKQIVDLDVSGVCERCKEIIEWKIRYKKYKPLTQPKKCVKCLEKTVKRAYYIVCQSCAGLLDVCAKCGESREVVSKYGLDPSEEARQESELNFELRNLSERKRRAFFRMQEKGEMHESKNKQDDRVRADGDDQTDDGTDSEGADTHTADNEGRGSELTTNESADVVGRDYNSMSCATDPPQTNSNEILSKAVN